MFPTTIDLDKAEKATSTLIPQTEQYDSIQYDLLTPAQRQRTTYLATYPTIQRNPADLLLLPNKTDKELLPDQWARRLFGGTTDEAKSLMEKYDYADLDGFMLTRQDVNELATRFHIDPTIVTFNAKRLKSQCFILMELHRSYRKQILQRRPIALDQPTLSSKQMCIILEFFLQFDVDLFFMKTCCYRNAQPRSTDSGIFCRETEPEARYQLVPCKEQQCQCCHPVNRSEIERDWPVVDFENSSKHQFLNEYITYLNCPMTCKETGMVYAMTCPCGKFDYIDSTPETLSSAMTFHRDHGNRIIHETLTGGYLVSNEDDHDLNNHSFLTRRQTRKMRLYQHSAHCPTALRAFLNCNPEYWCFIPMKWIDAIQSNIDHFKPAEDDIYQTIDDENIVYEDAIWSEGLIDDVPHPPTGYTFSYSQHDEQHIFFEKLRQSTNGELPYKCIDLYQYSVIALFPNETSLLLRYLITHLFVAHAEPKLNMICPIGFDPERRFGHVFKKKWCLDLDHPKI